MSTETKAREFTAYVDYRDGRLSLSSQSSKNESIRLREVLPSDQDKDARIKELEQQMIKLTLALRADRANKLNESLKSSFQLKSNLELRLK